MQAINYIIVNTIISPCNTVNRYPAYDPSAAAIGNYKPVGCACGLAHDVG